MKNHIIGTLKTFLITFIIEIFIKIISATILAIPFKISWNYIASKYFYVIPEVFYNIPYFEFIAILLVIDFVGIQLNKLVPKIISSKR